MNTKIKDILEKQTLSKADLTVLESYEPNAGQNRLYSFFTPIWLCQVMFDLDTNNRIINIENIK